MGITIDGAGTITGLDADGISAQPVFPGNVLQVVRATDSANRSTTSTSFVDAGISVTITPTRSDSAIMLIWSFVGRHASGGFLVTQITDSDNNAVSGAGTNSFGTFTASNNPKYTENTIGYSTPATILPITYKGRFRTSTATSSILNEENVGQLYAIEVAA